MSKTALIFLFSVLLFRIPVVQAKIPNVFVIEIRGDIDPRMSRYVELALKKAGEEKADYVLIDMNTFGGTLHDADQISTELLNFPITTIVWVNNKAFSAGALIALSCDSIYMSTGATIGAATVVFDNGKPAPDKFQAAMRSKMRAVAEEKDRDPEIAQDMVGEPVGTDSLSVGNVISFTTDEAIKAGFCEGKVISEKELLKKKMGLKKYSIEHFELSTVEKFIAIFLNPYLQGILLLIMLGGLYFELQTPGVGFPLIAAIIAALLYFVPSYLNGLAESWEILVFLAGIILLLLEILVIPGFGVTGILGIIFISAGIILMLLNNDNLNFEYVPEQAIVRAFVILFAALASAAILVFVGGARFLESKAFKKISLEEKLDSKEGYTSGLLDVGIIGKKGLSHTVLRPSGKVQIGDSVFDATTFGEFIERNRPVEVVSVSGNMVKVKESV